MNPKTIALAILLAVALLVTGCIASSAELPDQGEDKAAPSTVESESTIPSETPVEELPEREQRPSQTPPQGLERVDITPPAPVIGEVPSEILEEIFSDLVERTGANQAAIQVIRAEEVVWNDGSLGCPKPGEFYIQVLINGYWVVLEVDGAEYDFRVSDKGSFKLCEGENMVPVSPPDAGNQNPLVVQAKEDLAERLGIETTEIELLKIEEVTWRDGSLGCPQPGMLYTQALVNGSQIQLLHKETIYQYHSGRGGAPFLCENPPKDMDEAIAPGEAPPSELSDE